MKLNYKKTFILGLGFFCISLVWPLYNFYIPLFLKEFINSQFVINSIMTFDNILAVFMIPFFGSLSDNTNTRFGRRMPYLLIGIPISAVLFAILPTYTGFWSLIVLLFFLNLSMAIYRAPTIALMPDITPPPQRSKANGIINFMGGLASVLVFSVGAIMYTNNKNSPFIATAILMIIAVIVLYIFIKEPEKGESSEKEKISIIQAMKEIIESEDKTALYILLAIFFWFFGYQGIEATFSNYAVHYLGVSTKTGSFILYSFSMLFLIFAIPSGFIATKFSKKKTILTGITVLIGVFFILGFITPSTDIFSIPFNYLMMILMGIGGVFWSFININSYPMIVETTTEDKIGTYTGLYYFFSSLAAITGPLFFGLFIDLIGFKTMFFIAAISFALAFACILKTKPKEK